MQPCGARYHPICVRVGPPFKTRLRKEQGLHFPLVREWGLFICEYCTTRSVVERDLHGQNDRQLMMFERMRIIDTANAWASRTHGVYQAKLKFIRRFEHAYQFTCLQSTELTRPPHGPDIPLMWMQECYSLRMGRSTRDPVVFGSIRPLRSAASQFLTWDAALSSHGGSYLDGQRRVLLGDCRPTDNLAYTLFTQGQSTRIGDHPRPSTALLSRHIHWIDNHLQHRYLHTQDVRLRAFFLRAGFCNLVLWLGWLRSAETFSLRWCDISVIMPSQADQADLPAGQGALTLRLTPATKSSRSLTADVVIAFQCRSRLSLGWWWVHLCHNPLITPELIASTELIFRTAGTGQWTSLFFRTQVLYPSLYLQQWQGDGFLAPFHANTPQSIENKFWSLNSYRRGARTHAQRGRGLEKANTTQIYEHGRWRRRRTGEHIDVMYREWSLRDRLLITFYCF